MGWEVGSLLWSPAAMPERGAKAMESVGGQTIETEESVVDSGARASGLGLFRFPVGLTILADVSFN